MRDRARAISEFRPHEPRPLVRYRRCFYIEGVARYTALARYSEFGSRPLFWSRKSIASTGEAVGTSKVVRYKEVLYWEGPLSEVSLNVRVESS